MFPGALPLGGMTARLVFNGLMNRAAFQPQVERVLVPTLRPREMVIMDNLPAHKSSEVRRAIEATGRDLRYLPSYLPDLNPIENAFSKLRAILHRAATRTIDSL